MTNKDYFEEIDINPDWKGIEKLEYQVYRQDLFRYAEKTRDPIENQYSIKIDILRRNPNVEFRVSYPKGILFLLTSFQPFAAFKGIEDQFQSEIDHSFLYQLDEKNQEIKVLDESNIDTYFDFVRAKIKNKRVLENGFSFVEDKKDQLNYICRDLELIHQYFDSKIPLNFSHSLDESPEKKGPIGLALKGLSFLSELNFNISETSLLKTEKLENEVLLDYIWGINLYSVKPEERTDFKTIKDDFFTGKFDIDNYQNITLHRKQYKYSLKDKILNFYRFDRRTVNSQMRKLEIKQIQRKM